MADWLDKKYLSPNTVSARAKVPAPSCWYKPIAISATAATTSIRARKGRQNHPNQTVKGIAPSKMPFS
ncbi:hypothetical protein D3C71_1927330 [compost metagenome]